MSARASAPDDRGQVAIVYASHSGPAVTFVGQYESGRTHAQRLTASLRVLARIWVTIEDKPVHLPPTRVHLQMRPGVWEPA